MVIKWRSGSFDSSCIWWSGASCNRLALVWHLLKQTWYLDILITYCFKKTIPKTQDHTTSNTFIASWCSWNFHMFPYGSQVFPCFSTCFETSSSADIHSYAHVHHQSFSKATHLTSKHRLLRLLGAFRFLHIPTMLGSKDPDLLEFRRRFAESFHRENGIVGADRLDRNQWWSTRSFRWIHRSKLIWGCPPDFSNQRSYWSFCKGMPRNAENPGINYSKL